MYKILLTIFLAAVLLTAGCNGTNDQSNNGGNTQTTAAVSVTEQTFPAGGSTETTRSGETEQTTPTTRMLSTTTMDAASSGGALDDIKGLLGMGLTQWMVDYQMSISHDGLLLQGRAGQDRHDGERDRISDFY